MPRTWRHAVLLSKRSPARRSKTAAFTSTTLGLVGPGSGHRRPRSPRPRLPEPRTSSPTRESDTVAPTLARPRCHLQDRLRHGKCQPSSRTTPYNTTCLRACRGGRAADVDTGSMRSAPEAAAVTGVLCTGRDATCSVHATTRRHKSYIVKFYVLVVILLQHGCAGDRPHTRRSGHSCDPKSSYGVGRIGKMIE